MHPDGCELAINRKKDNEVTICRHDALSNFDNVAVFLLSSLVTDPTFMLIS